MVSGDTSEETSDEAETFSSVDQVSPDPQARFVEQEYRDFLASTFDPLVEKTILYLRCLPLRVFPEHEKEQEMSESELEEIAKRFLEEKETPKFVKSVILSHGPCEEVQAGEARERLMTEYKDRVFGTKLPKDPPVRGPANIGEASIEICPGVSAVKQRPFQLVGERREAMIKLVQGLIDEGKIEKGISPWCSPAFPVAKKVLGDYRLVVDFRKLNEATVTDGHPLPRIEEILIRQGKFKIWTVLDLKDGFHQVPIKKECKHLTCMSTPIGVYCWKVMPMGLKNAPAIFQRLMEYILQDVEYADPYIDDIIIGSTAENMEDLLDKHEQDVRKVLDILESFKIVVSPKKVQLFMTKVEFCGHVLHDGKRYPAPGKLMALQKWELLEL